MKLYFVQFDSSETTKQAIVTLWSNLLFWFFEVLKKWNKQLSLCKVLFVFVIHFAFQAAIWGLIQQKLSLTWHLFSLPKLLEILIPPDLKIENRNIEQKADTLGIEQLLLGKYQCMAGIQLYKFEFSCFTSYLLVNSSLVNQWPIL